MVLQKQIIDIIIRGGGIADPIIGTIMVTKIIKPTPGPSSSKCGYKPTHEPKLLRMVLKAFDTWPLKMATVQPPQVTVSWRTKTEMSEY